MYMYVHANVCMYMYMCVCILYVCVLSCYYRFTHFNFCVLCFRRMYSTPDEGLIPPKLSSTVCVVIEF